ncbi:MAG: Proline--tRNA ligase [Firmicutes bacterium]|nr:Proline--tRNA ligase [candidate division NPL-UPA2 bacterium]
MHTTSWGVSTRLIGALVMVHGDDKGVAVPPKLAPTQVVMIPIGPPKLRERVMEKFDGVFAALKQAGVRVKSDVSDATPGFKFNDWEMRGVPLRLELGPRDVDSNQCVLVRRDTGEKTTASLDNIVARVKMLLDEIQLNMYQRALSFRLSHSHTHINSLTELKEHIAAKDAAGEIAGWVLAGWCGDEACEAKVKEEVKFTSRNIPFDPPAEKSHCVTCGQAAAFTLWLARAY